jgi:hypothetical protein
MTMTLGFAVEYVEYTREEAWREVSIANDDRNTM